MSIVLVIIGLLVGGILTGQSLIDAAAQRAQIAQIDKYNTAVRTFQGKYGYLPGDIPDPYASQFGFMPRGTLAGEGDGNGVIEGNCSNTAGANTGFQQGGRGELPAFWVDLTTASLIDAGIVNNGVNYPSPTLGVSGNITFSSTPTITAWLPASKLGNNNFVYVYSYGGTNYFTVSAVDDIGCSVDSVANPGLTVQQAYNVDSKIDDGLPQTGNVQACYINHNIVAYAAVWAAGGGLQGANGGSNCTPTTNLKAYAPTNCYDNNGIVGTQKYSVSQNANTQNCALSFKFQ